jgi:hypothetical protein
MRNFTTVGMLCNFMVSNYFENIFVTGNEPDMTVITTTGLQLDKRGTGEQCSDNTWINIVMEGVGTGILMPEAIMNTFIGGTSEGNGTGVSIGVNSLDNTFLGLDLEVNTVIDITCAGIRNVFSNCLSDSQVTITGGNGNQIVGGQVVDLTIDAGANGTVLLGVGYIGTLTDNGTDTSKHAVFFITGAVLEADTSPKGLTFGGSNLSTYIENGTWTVVPTGLTVVGTPTYVGKYSRIGNIVHWSVLFSATTSTSSAGAAGTSFNLPIACNSNGSTCSAANMTTAEAYLNGLVFSTVCYPPAWAATASVVVSGTYLF